MLTRSQLLWLGLMSLAGGSLSAFLVIGVFVGDLDYVIGSAVWILALFTWLFIFTDKGQKPAKKLDLTYKHGQIDQWVRQTNYKRAGDIKVGGEVLPEFQADLLESVRQMKAGKAARTHKASINMM